MSFSDLEQIRAVIKVRGRTVWDPASFLPPEVVIDWASVLGGTPQEASLTAVAHMVFPDESFAALEKLRARLAPLLGEGLSTHLPPNYYNGNYHLLLRSKRMIKYRGTVRLLEKYSLATHQLLFSGDWRNDIPM